MSLGQNEYFFSSLTLEGMPVYGIPILLNWLERATAQSVVQDSNYYM